MAFARIEIEQLERDRWVAEVELGGLIARRRRVTAHDFHQVIAQVIATHDEFAAHPAHPVRPIGEPRPAVAVEAPKPEGPVQDTEPAPAAPVAAARAARSRKAAR